MSQQGSAPARPLYDHIEGIRLRKGWSKSRLAREAGVNRGTLENWKIQPKPPTAETIKAVAEALSIDQDLALRLAGYMPPDQERPVANESSNEAIDARITALELEIAKLREERQAGRPDGGKGETDQQQRGII